MSKIIREFSDEELAREAQSGSRSCFEELAGRYGHRLFYFLRPRLESDQDTEDLVQDVFLKIFRSLASYDPERRFSTWLYTAAHRMAISYFRARGIRRKTRISAGENVPEDPARLLEERRKREGIWATARELSPIRYEALWLRYGEEMDVRQIARVMRRSPLAVRMLLHRARIDLAVRLNPVEDAHETARRGASLQNAAGKESG